MRCFYCIMANAPKSLAFKFAKLSRVKVIANGYFRNYINQLKFREYVFKFGDRRIFFHVDTELYQHPSDKSAFRIYKRYTEWYYTSNCQLSWYGQKQKVPTIYLPSLSELIVRLNFSQSWSKKSWYLYSLDFLALQRCLQFTVFLWSYK